jgi:hypothetical protein
MGWLMLALIVSLFASGCHQMKVATLSGGTRTFASSSVATSVATAAARPDFETEIKPIFQVKCQPCHFPGGKVYDQMPFDKPETISRLGTKLFTRIKDEKEQRAIREFLAP